MKSLGRSQPHGEQAIELVDDQPKFADRIFRITDTSGREITLLGSELESLLDIAREDGR